MCFFRRRLLTDRRSRRNIFKRKLCILCLLFAAGLYLWDPSGEAFLSPPDAQLAAYIHDHPKVTLQGRVGRQAAGEKSFSIYLQNAYLSIYSKKYQIGNLRIFFKNDQQLKSGMDVIVQGELYPPPSKRNPGAFDGRIYYACQGIYYLMEGQQVLEKSKIKNWPLFVQEEIKRRASKILEKVAKEEAGIFVAILLGDSAEVEPEVKDVYRAGGILHLLAISGLHLSLLGMGCFHFLECIGIGLKLRAFHYSSMVFNKVIFTEGTS